MRGVYGKSFSHAASAAMSLHNSFPIALLGSLLQKKKWFPKELELQTKSAKERKVKEPIEVPLHICQPVQPKKWDKVTQKIRVISIYGHNTSL